MQRSGNLALAIALLGVGSLLVWVGYADPAGGLWAVITNAVTGKHSTAKPKNGGSDVFALAGQLAGSTLAAGVAAGGAAINGEAAGGAAGVA